MKIIYLFFRALCGIGAKTSPDIGGALRKLEYQPLRESSFAAGVLWSALFQKTRA
jgi:hypothetical protein